MIPVWAGAFSEQLLAFWGETVTLQDATTIEAIRQYDEQTQVIPHANFYRDRYVLHFLAKDQGSLAEQQTVTIGGEVWYVASITPRQDGWKAASINKQP